MSDISRLPLNVLVAHADTEASTAEGAAVAALIDELRDLGIEVLRAMNAEDVRLLAEAHPNLHAVLLDRDLGSDGSDLGSVIGTVRGQAESVPVFVLDDTHGVDDLPTQALTLGDGVVYLFDDSADWIAGRIRDAALRYRDALLPPMFKGLVDFAETHEYSWHTPGHTGGAAFRKSAVGRMFWEFFGEQTFRSDLSISVGELGSLLDHSGPIGRAEREAAEIFGADATFFVTNGTSTSNRVIYQGSTTAGDVVVCDRNAHKSIEQANTMNHTLPVYLVPTRNRWGIIGPIPPSEMTAESVAAKIAASPIAPDGASPVLATVTNSTYDGLLYHVPTVDETLGAHVDRIHYDEAWYGYAAFNPMYHERHAMHSGRRSGQGPTTFATQSTHKLLAALSQASLLHIRDGRNAPDRESFNEAFMMHASTSPLYAIIASNDVAARMMRGESGRRLTDGSIQEAVAFRKTMERVGRDLGDDWFFRCWQPDVVTDATGSRVAFADAPEAWLAGSAEPWQLHPGDTWHGFEGLPEGYAMLDPIKVTVLTPGIADDGSLEERGVPAAIVTAYLDQQASIVVEKTQDYSILFLFSIGVTRGKWGSLVATLLDCKRDLDDNAPLESALPATFATDPGRYAGMGLRDLADQMHAAMGQTGQMGLLHDAFSSLPEPAMANAEAYAHVVQGTLDVVRVDDLGGRTVATGVVPYPPGIPLLMPGERAGDGDGPYLGYLKALQDFDRRFPGFEHDIHGVEHVDGDYLVRCVRETR